MKSWSSHDVGAVVAVVVQGAVPPPPRPGRPPVAVASPGGIMPAQNGPVERGRLRRAAFMVA